jgi:hypothetical protein
MQVPHMKITIRYLDPREFWDGHWIGYLFGLLPENWST